MSHGIFVSCPPRSMSILLWVKHQGVIGPVLDFGYGKFRIWLVETDGTFDINFETASGPNLFKLLKTEANKWHHIGLSYEQDTGKVQFTWCNLSHSICSI